jgi:hypothetical protein
MKRPKISAALCGIFCLAAHLSTASAQTPKETPSLSGCPRPFMPLSWQSLSRFDDNKVSLPYMSDTSTDCRGSWSKLSFEVWELDTKAGKIEASSYVLHHELSDLRSLISVNTTSGGLIVGINPSDIFPDSLTWNPDVIPADSTGDEICAGQAFCNAPPLATQILSWTHPINETTSLTASYHQSSWDDPTLRLHISKRFNGLLHDLGL